jgi:hypothetical protein
MNYQLILSNSGGELSRDDATSEAGAREVAIRIIQELPFLAHGDTIQFVEIAEEAKRLQEQIARMDRQIAYLGNNSRLVNQRAALLALQGQLNRIESGN